MSTPTTPLTSPTSWLSSTASPGRDAPRGTAVWQRGGEYEQSDKHKFRTQQQPNKIRNGNTRTHYDDNFIQNKSFEIDAFYKGTPLQIGYDVNPSESYGNVVVKSGSSLNVDVGSGGVVIKKGFECGKGATLEIK